MALPELGYRFRPSDNELLSFLQRKNDDPRIELKVPEINLSESNPWEIPGALGELWPSEDEMWYFFSLRECFHGKGKQFKRKTKSGSWKITGNRKEIVDGVTRTYLVHCNKASDPGEMTDWVIHEYALSNPLQDQTASFVICCLKKPKKKTSTGSKSKRAKKDVGTPENQPSSYAASDVVIPEPPPAERIFEMFSPLDFPCLVEDGSSCNVASNHETPPTATSVGNGNNMFIPQLPSPEGDKDTPVQNECPELEEMLKYFVPDEEICGDHTLDGIFNKSSPMTSSEMDRILGDLVSCDMDSGENVHGSGPLAPSSY